MTTLINNLLTTLEGWIVDIHIEAMERNSPELMSAYTALCVCRGTLRVIAARLLAKELP